MKLKTGYELQSREGEEKIVNKFIWFPTCFDNDLEKIWLENVDVVYQIKKVDVGEYHREWKWKWLPERFATDEDRMNLPIENRAGDWYDRTEKRLKNPITWLCLDALAGASMFVSVILGITFFLTIKVIQVFSYLTFRE